MWAHSRLWSVMQHGVCFLISTYRPSFLELAEGQDSCLDSEPSGYWWLWCQKPAIPLLPPRSPVSRAGTDLSPWWRERRCWSQAYDDSVPITFLGWKTFFLVQFYTTFKSTLDKKLHCLWKSQNIVLSQTPSKQLPGTGMGMLTRC